MQFFKNVMLFAAAASSVSAMAIVPRAASDVVNALTTVDGDVKTLTSQVKAWNGTVGGASPILSTASKLDNDIKSATTVVNNQSKFNAADSNTVLNYVKNPLLPDIQAAVAALKSRKADSDKAGTTPTVRSRLTTIRADTNTLINALKAKADSSVQSSATTTGNQVLAALDDAIKTYGG